ncbi:MAG: pyridoxamine 5'-phosphate oxidase family protein [Prevotellaceae bacterium]|jgi:nitroimidazol reductase NimA-like FMN-containing flavoprotein (pyridoxamine 5'-phosphate oxidase superfamily)|nr:pyridoxamine 5'-phosphate oxidase family protein [Prevotellaceae bacterium]
MRRKDRKITDKHEMLDILNKADACRIAFAVNNTPYIVCMNFGYEWDGKRLKLYFHCAKEGKKLDLMRRNNYVCFQIDTDHMLEYIPEIVYCTMQYKSIVGMGYLEEVTDDAERVKGLDLLMQHHGHNAPAQYPEASLKQTMALCLKVSEISAKKKA